MGQHRNLGFSADIDIFLTLLHYYTIPGKWSGYREEQVFLKSASILALGAIISILASSCLDQNSIDYGQETAVVAMVTDIRISTASRVYSKGGSGHAVLGAILGGAVAGTKGAVIGGAIGADSNTPVTREVKEEITGCKVIFQLEHGPGLVFTFTGAGPGARECSLLSPGDRTYITKVGREPRVLYVWNTESFNWKSAGLLPDPKNVR